MRAVATAGVGVGSLHSSLPIYGGRSGFAYSVMSEYFILKTIFSNLRSSFLNKVLIMIPWVSQTSELFVIVKGTLETLEISYSSKTSCVCFYTCKADVGGFSGTKVSTVPIVRTSDPTGLVVGLFLHFFCLETALTARGRGRGAREAREGQC